MTRLRMLVGQRLIQEPYLPPLSDQIMMNWFRGVPTEAVPAQNIAYSFDTRYLQPLLYFIARTHHARVIVEIGCHDGSTAWPLAKAASEVGGKVISVDPKPDVRATAIIEASGFSPYWELVPTTSDEFFRSQGAGLGIDFAFVDGDHTCAQVARDANNILRRLVPNGIIVFHDWGNASPSWTRFDDTGQSPIELPVAGGARPDDEQTVLAGRDGVMRALRMVLLDWDVDVMPLHFGILDQAPDDENVEGGALIVRKRGGQYRVR